MNPSTLDVPSPVSDVGHDTRERLLEAGLEIFAARGFQDASLRQICAHAGTNSAAVNYHFGSKKAFYAEVLVTSHRRAVASRRMPRLADDPQHPERVFRSWIRWFLELLLVQEASSPLGQLMAREMFAPTEALEELARRSVLPIYRTVRELIEVLVADPSDPTPIDHLSLERMVNSVMGQVLFYKHAQPAVTILRSLMEPDASSHEPPGADLDRLAQHITDFSIAGLRTGRFGDLA